MQTEEEFDTQSVTPLDNAICYKLDRSDREEREFQEIVRKKLKAGDYRFSRFIFRNDLTLSGVSFRNAVDFSDASFLGRVHFVNADFGYNASFRHATFDRPAIFSDAVFHHRADFGSATFGDEAGFMGASFHETADFVATKFQGEGSFYRSHFRADCAFRRTQFVGGATFDHVTFDGPAIFEGATSPTNLPIVCSNTTINTGHGASFYRLAKQSSQSSGDYTSAGRYHYLERCHMWYEPLMGKKRGEQIRTLLIDSPSSLVELLFGRLVFGYGEKVTRPLLSGIVIILIFAFLFLLNGIQSTVDEMRLEKQVSELTTMNTSLIDDVGYCVYFSAVTFATLGYGDLRPAGRVSRMLANIESLLGIVLSATFAVSLAKKYTRG
jgi:uncharacterized protein YjbI with pentapeptide repeats